MEQFLNALNLWLNEHQHFILISIAALSFLESLAVVGLLVPGIALLFAASTAAGSSGIPLLWVLTSAIFGAILGDGISFLLGYRYHYWLYKAPILKKHPEWIQKSEHIINQYGLIGIVFGRFIGPARPFMPIIAGAMQMRPISFFSVNITSAFAWAPFYLLPGYLVGASLENEQALGVNHLIFLLSLLLLAWVCAQCTWLLYRHIQSRRQKNLLALLTALALFSLFLMTSQLMQLNTFLYLNQAATLWWASMRHAWLDVLFIPLTAFGDMPAMFTWGSLVAICLLAQRNLYALTLWISITLTSYGLLQLFKNGFNWPRPNLLTELPATSAFPSGHTLMTTIFLGLLLIISLPSTSPRRQKAVMTTVFVLIFIMATSRLYLTLHWVSDALGGLLLAGAILSMVYLIILKKPFIRVNPLPILIVSLFSWCFNFVYWVFPEQNNLYRSFELRQPPNDIPRHKE